MNDKPILALLCCALGLAGSDADARDRHALWSVEGRHNTVYLLGSVHVLRAGDGELPAVAEAAYEDAEQLVMEIDLDDPLGGDPGAMLGLMQQTALLPEETSLREVMGADYDAVNARAQESGLDLALFDRFAPWLVAITILQLELTKRGFSPELGVEQTLATRAMADGKPILGLETAEQQFGLLAGLPLPQQKRFLMMTLDDAAQLDEQVDDLIRAWKTGDAETLSRLLSEEFAEFPELYKALTEDRNREWLDDIVDLLDDRDDYLVVVGALHLVGRNSVVDLLRQRGYEVTQQ